MEYRWEPYNDPVLVDAGLGKIVSNEFGVEPLVLENVTLTDARKLYPDIRDMRNDAQLFAAVQRHDCLMRRAYREGRTDEADAHARHWYEAMLSWGQLQGDTPVGPVETQDVLA